MKPLKFYSFLFLLLTIFILGACDGGGSSGGGTGTLSLSLTDKTTYIYDAVYVTIDEIQVHLGGNENSPNNWTSVNMPQSPLTVNLLELADGVREDLGIVQLSAGRYTQMRLIIGDRPDDSINIFSQDHPHANYVIYYDDEESDYVVQELKIPSGSQTGVKIVQGFTISDGHTTEILLDFDAMRSVVQAGSSGQWLLKPTIKVLELEEYAIVGGLVENNSQIEGAMVSLQSYDSQEQDDEFKVIVEAATTTDPNGVYSIFIEPGTYNLVVYANEYRVACRSITLKAGDNLVEDFVLSEASQTRNVTGSVSIPNSGDEQYATLSFRQIATCDGASEDQLIEVISLNILDTIYDDTYDITLPEGDYVLVAFTYGRDTETYDLNMTITNQDVILN